jgi:hypothetical protein
MDTLEIPGILRMWPQGVHIQEHHNFPAWLLWTQRDVPEAITNHSFVATYERVVLLVVDELVSRSAGRLTACIQIPCIWASQIELRVT